MSEVYLTIREICALEKLTDRRVRQKAKAEVWESQLSEGRTGNRKRERCYPLTRLSPAAQLRYAEQQVSQATAIVPAARTLPLFAAAPEAVVEARRNDLTPAEKAVADARYLAIAPLLDFRRRTNGTRPKIQAGDGRTIETLADLAAYVGAQQAPPVSTSTLFRWLRRYETKGGWAGLSDPPRRDKGTSRFFLRHPNAKVFVRAKGQSLKEDLSVQMIWEALRREWPNLRERGAPPSYSTVAEYLRGVPRPLAVLAKEGPQAYERTCSPFILRSNVPAMDWWVADHRVFDVQVSNALFPWVPPGAAYRMWLTAVYDWGSRTLVGFCFAPRPNSATINSALRMAALQYGFPRNLYWDNGKDFQKAGAIEEEVRLSENAQRLLRDRCLEVTYALPRHPRSKPIESWFTRWSKRFDRLWHESYLGNSPGACPEIARMSQVLHRKYLQGKRAESPLPMDVIFIVAAVQWIEEYNRTPLESLGGRTPAEVLDEQWPAESRPKIEPRELDMLLEACERTVLPGGCVEIDRLRYEPTDQSLYALDLRQGQRIRVLRDPYDLTQAVARDPETRQFVGELRLQQLVAQGAHGQISREDINAAMGRQRRPKRAYSEYLGALAAISTRLGWQTELEALLERAGIQRAQLHTGTDGAGSLPAPKGAPGARLALPERSPLPAIRTFAADVSEEDAALLDQVEVEE